jgi:hypothetical protein
MRYVTKSYAIAGLIGLLSLCSLGQTQKTNAINADFESRAAAYATKHRKIKSRLPKLPTEATAEQVAAHKASLLSSLKTSRTSAIQGNFFTPETARLFRSVIRDNYSDADLAELRRTVIEAETAGVPIKVNAEYPEAKEKLEMPSRLLLVLPQMPAELSYRFVGKYLLVVDKGTGLIIDFMANAIP